MLNADVLAVQAVWDEMALRAALASSGLQYGFVSVPGAENGPYQHGAQGTPRVGIVTRLKVESIESLADFAAAAVVAVPGVGLHTRFEHPPLLATLRMKHDQPAAFITAHLKSKRPKFLRCADGQPLEDPADPAVQAVASLRSLMMRASAALEPRNRTWTCPSGPLRARLGRRDRSGAIGRVALSPRSCVCAWVQKCVFMRHSKRK